MIVCCGLDSFGNKEPHSCALTPFPHQWDREENQKEKAKLMGCDKNSLTEWQREKKITTITQMKRIYSMQCPYCPMLSSFLSSKSPCFSQLPHLNTDHDITWYKISQLIGRFWSAQPASCEN